MSQITDTDKKIRAVSAVALTLGILGIVFAIIMGFLFGIIGAGVSFIIGVIAIILGIKTKKKSDKNKGKGGVATGVIAVILACTVCAAAFVISDIARGKVNEMGFTLLAEKADSLRFGFIGLVWGLPDEEKLDELTNELDIAVRERAAK